MKFTRFLKGLLLVVITGAPILLLLWLINRNYLLTSGVSFRFPIGSMKKSAVQIERFNQLVAERRGSQGLHWKLAKDGLGFTFRLPKQAQRIEVSLRVRSKDQPLLQFTALGSKKMGDRHTILQDRSLNALAWKKMFHDGLTFWQRPLLRREQTEPTPQKKRGEATIPSVTTVTSVQNTPIRHHSSLEAFLKSNPDWLKVALLGIHSLAFVRIPNYQPAINPISFDHAFRGSLVFYVYAENEDLQLSFDKVDLNRTRGKDPLLIQVEHAVELRSSRRKIALSQTVADDGDVTSSGKVGPGQRVTVSLPQADPGIYRFTIDTSDDVVIHNLSSLQHYLAFVGTVFFADGKAYGIHPFKPLELVVSGSASTFEAAHPEGTQEILIDGKPLQIKKAKHSQTETRAKPPTTYILERADLTFFNDGFITVKPALPLPSAGAAMMKFQPPYNLDGYDYVIADYTPTNETEIFNFQDTYSVSDLSVRRGNVSFRLDAPGLRSGDHTVDLEKLEIRASRGPLRWSPIIARIRNFVKSIL